MCCPEKVVVSRVAGRVSQAEATAKTSPGVGRHLPGPENERGPGGAEAQRTLE